MNPDALTASATPWFRGHPVSASRLLLTEVGSSTASYTQGRARRDLRSKRRTKAQSIIYDASNRLSNGLDMITAAQLRAARALLGIDQRVLAEMSGLSTPTIQRMEASDGVIRGNVDSLMKLIRALDAAGLELIGEGAASPGGGRGIRLK